MVIIWPHRDRLGSPSSRRAWIEMDFVLVVHQASTSPSSRRAWIEISMYGFSGSRGNVALLAEGVDRNVHCPCDNADFPEVALLAEGVDRNRLAIYPGSLSIRSPSSRRAWIEMAVTCSQYSWSTVALLAEGVDRNGVCVLPHKRGKLSPSSRRAWIEIAAGHRRHRNCPRRPPRGGRG